MHARVRPSPSPYLPLMALGLLLSGALFSVRAAQAQTAVAASSASASAALPGDSVYHLKPALADQDGRAFVLKDLRGKPALVSMFYNSCEFVCPMLVDTMRMTRQELSPAQRERLQMLLITFDPARDDVAALKDVVRKHKLDTADWRIARPTNGGARQIGSALGIQYRQLGNGDFNHTTVLILLDAEGRMVGRTEKMGEADPAFVALVKKTLR